jgi:hypothetical protein
MSTLKQIGSIASRSQSTLLSDAAGAAALVTLFVIALHIPALV